MSVVAYLLDENVPPSMLRAFRRRWPTMEVGQIGDEGAPPLGALDLEILEWCEVHERSLVTYNRRSMPAHLRAHLAAGRHVPGIFTLDDSGGIGETIDRLALVWGASDAEEYRDQIVHLTHVT